MVDYFEIKKKILNIESQDDIDDITRLLDWQTLRVLIKFIVWTELK